MDLGLPRRIQQLHQMSKDGVFGEVVQRDAHAYDHSQHTTMSIFLDVVRDFYSNEARLSQQQLAELTDLFCQLFIVVYREAKRADPAVADALLHAFLKDYPGAPDTCIYPQWDALLQACHGFKASLTTSNRLLLWQHSLRLTQAYNEFLNVLLGYYLVAWRTALGKTVSTNVLYNSYGAKVNEFSSLTNGSDGPFYLLFRIAKPHLRNAIAHEQIWLDSESNTIRYADGKDALTQYEMPLTEFVVLNGVGSNLALAYIAAVAAVAVLEVGSASDVAQLPAHLVKLFHFQVQQPAQ
jgi:hypothetical protein